MSTNDEKKAAADASKRAETIATQEAANDVGVPMAEGDEHVGPEDAFAPETRGDYAGRVSGEAEHYTTEPIPLEERVPDGPTQRAVLQVPASNTIEATPEASPEESDADKG